VFAAERPNIDIIIAGDLNVLLGYGEHGNRYWAARYETVFNRMKVPGFAFVGPQAPNGRRAEPWPKELPRTSNNVPTYHTRRQTPSTCTRQLDFVFVSKTMLGRVQVKALNEPEEWGPSDHCRIEIDVMWHEGAAINWPIGLRALAGLRARQFSDKQHSKGMPRNPVSQHDTIGDQSAKLAYQFRRADWDEACVLPK